MGLRRDKESIFDQIRQAYEGAPPAPSVSDEMSQAINGPSEQTMDISKVLSPSARGMAGEAPQIDVNKLESPDAKKQMLESYLKPKIEPTTKISEKGDILEDPNFEKYDDAIARAERRADKTRLYANLGQSLNTITEGLTGSKLDNSLYQNMSKQADQPVSAAMSRQKAIRDYLDKKADRSMKEKQYEKELALLNENVRHNRSMEDLQREATSAKTAEANKPKQIPAAQVANFKEGETIPRNLDLISTLIDEKKNLFGPVSGRMHGANPWDEEAQTTQAKMKAVAQQVGRFLEGGILRKEDEIKYEKMLPNLNDKPEVAKQKLEFVRDLVAKKQESLIEALKGQNYDISGFQQSISKTAGEGDMVTIENEKGERRRVTREQAKQMGAL